MIDTPTTDPLVSLAEIAEIELFILKRMKELTLGDHASVFRGHGFDFVGVRSWEPGDRLSSVDWAQSSLTNFSPLISREFEQDSNATVLAVADASLSTRCGVGGAVVGTAIARAVATLGLSAVLSQNLFGMITFDDAYREFGPGVLLELENIRAFHERREHLWMDSCAVSDHVMVSRLWPDRRTIVSVAAGTGKAGGDLIVSALPLVRWTARLLRRKKPA